MSLNPPCMPSTPDIAGSGVRIALYIQNLVSFIPAWIALSDKTVDLEELKNIEEQSSKILIPAFALLISAMSQARSDGGLPNFYASIILNLSWINNASTLTYMVLYIHHKSQPGDDGKIKIESNVSSWTYHIKTKLSEFFLLHSKNAKCKLNSSVRIRNPRLTVL
jgi:hypothetical protein